MTINTVRRIVNNDPEIVAIANLIGPGFPAITSQGQAAARTLTGTANQITVTNGAGVGGNPTVSLPDDLSLVRPVVGSHTADADNFLKVRNDTVGWNIGILGSASDQFYVYNAVTGKRPLTINAATDAVGVALDLEQVITEPSSFWTDSGGRVNIARLDRVFVGGAGADATGSYDNGQGSVADTEDVGADWALREAQLLVVNKKGSMSVVGYSRASDSAAPTAAIGVAGFLKNDIANGFGWAMYADVQQEDGTAGSAGMEVALKNKSSTNTIWTPYNFVQGGLSGIGLAMGGDPAYGGASVSPVTAGLTFSRNSNSSNSGIVFFDGSLTDDGAGHAEAIAFYKGNKQNWYYSAAGIGFGLWSEVALAADEQRLVVDSSGFNFRNNSALNTFRVAKISGALTGNLAVVPSTSATPILQAEGSATNIDIQLTPKGTGLVQVGGSGLRFGGSGAILAAPATDAQARAKSSTTTILTPSNLAGMAAVSAHKNATNQTGIATSTFTKVTFGTEELDNAGVYASSTLTVPNAGRWRIAANCRVSTALTGPSFLSLYKNGARFKDGGYVAASPADCSVVGDWLVDAAASDTFEIYAFFVSAAGATIEGNAIYTQFYAHQL